jgi:hypothetical protein
MTLIQLMAGTIEADRRRETDRRVRARIVEQAIACCTAASTGLRRGLARLAPFGAARDAAR